MLFGAVRCCLVLFESSRVDSRFSILEPFGLIGFVDELVYLVLHARDLVPPLPPAVVGVREDFMSQVPIPEAGVSPVTYTEDGPQSTGTCECGRI